MEEIEPFLILTRTYLSCERDTRLARFETLNAETKEEREDALLRLFSSSYKSDEALYALSEELKENEEF